ncbi:hypothetical protein ANN_24939 [Periplaneta americana]|uniref:Mos1 transposase HTH domain-containing protein n=1 Tax=Periplaneta americana TaxID=6978 RepID=A0ABQ8RZZ3_PERAM|nr:hypothetical protein ANN_24939 [Periplaneta americana]
MEIRFSPKSTVDSLLFLVANRLERFITSFAKITSSFATVYSRLWLHPTVRRNYAMPLAVSFQSPWISRVPQSFEPANADKSAIIHIIHNVAAEVVYNLKMGHRPVIYPQYAEHGSRKVNAIKSLHTRYIQKPDRSRLVPVEWQQCSEMEALIPSPAACEVRSVIKFFNAQSIAPIEIHRQLCQVYGPNIMSKQMVHRWCRQFSEGRQSVHDEERSGRPSLINDDHVKLVRQCIMENRRFTITELSSHFP